jgi:hypothetical protein
MSSAANTQALTQTGVAVDGRTAGCDCTCDRDRHLFCSGPKRMLALDGGGVRGAITVAFLEQIEAVRTGNVRTSKFTARVVVRPGWGLPGGPSEEGLPPLHTVDPVAGTDSATSTEAVP